MRNPSDKTKTIVIGLIVTSLLLFIALKPMHNREGHIVNPKSGKTLVFRDEFNTWNSVWSTRESAYTTESTCAKASVLCARTHDGKMVLSVREDTDNPGKYLTGHIGTKGDKQFTYGYFEAKIEFPAIRGALCAWWLQTTEDYIPGQAEIDIAENGGGSKIWHNVYWRDLGQTEGQFHDPPVKISTDLGKGDKQADQHVYGLDWLPDRYDFYIDDKKVATTTEGLSDRPKFLVLSIKLPDYLVNGSFNPSQLKEYKMKTSWVKVWQ